MWGILERITPEDLRQVVGALRSGRLVPPYSSVAVGRHVQGDAAGELSQEIRRLSDEGMQPGHLALMMETAAELRAGQISKADIVELVTSGPEAPGVANRDTAVVVRELFLNASKDVLVAGYAVFQGRQVFRALGERMDTVPDLRVRMFLDIQRPHTDTSMASELVRRFAVRFREREWPGKRLPDIYYDPRSLETDGARKASLHAKCIVIDGEFAFVSSANFTEAAQVKNIEVGVLIRSVPIARKIAGHFDALRQAEYLRSISWS